MIVTPLTAAAVLYLVANLCVFLLYGMDKHRARAGDWRIPERILLLAALVGPFGAYGAMRLFRHKTQKTLFLLVPVFLVLHITGILYLAWLLYQGSGIPLLVTLPIPSF
jgi:Predicted membrane protein